MTYSVYGYLYSWFLFMLLMIACAFNDCWCDWDWCNDTDALHTVLATLLQYVFEVHFHSSRCLRVIFRSARCIEGFMIQTQSKLENAHALQIAMYVFTHTTCAHRCHLVLHACRVMASPKWMAQEGCWIISEKSADDRFLRILTVWRGWCCRIREVVISPIWTVRRQVITGDCLCICGCDII